MRSKSRYIRWQDGEMWLGYFEQFPDSVTKGDSRSDLEENLRDLYRDLTSGEIPGMRRVGEPAME
ncbi:MAG: type II toxin-antitoxin system HicB family antitoxin [Acidobacteria bacterium]|jgi:predicted RNase H-like HicB family nuclease|nr:type II toxin-antitoxin system HicB family antitoxin [Acidobacteriota bacterium]